MPNADEIMAFLEELKGKDPRIKACMVAKRGLEGLIMFPPNFKEEISTVWDPLSKNVDDVLSMVARYSSLGLKRMYSEILGYGIFFVALPASDTALAVFTKEENNMRDFETLMGYMDGTVDRILERF